MLRKWRNLRADGTYPRTIIQLDHGIQHAPLYRFQTIPYIRKRSGCDNAHRVIDIGVLHGLLQIDFFYFVKDMFVHSVPLLNVYVRCIFCICFNKFSSWLDLVTHQCRKGDIKILRILIIDHDF